MALRLRSGQGPRAAKALARGPSVTHSAAAAGNDQRRSEYPLCYFLNFFWFFRQAREGFTTPSMLACWSFRRRDSISSSDSISPSLKDFWRLPTQANVL